MHSPYTEHYALAVAIGSACTGTTLGALAAARPLPTPTARRCALASIAAASMVPFVTLALGEGSEATTAATILLHAALLAATASVLLLRRRTLAWAALGGHVALGWLGVPNVPPHGMAALELVWI